MGEQKKEDWLPYIGFLFIGLFVGSILMGLIWFPSCWVNSQCEQPIVCIEKPVEEREPTVCWLASGGLGVCADTPDSSGACDCQEVMNKDFDLLAKEIKGKESKVPEQPLSLINPEPCEWEPAGDGCNKCCGNWCTLMYCLDEEEVQEILGKQEPVAEIVTRVQAPIFSSSSSPKEKFTLSGVVGPDNEWTLEDFEPDNVFEGHWECLVEKPVRDLDEMDCSNCEGVEGFCFCETKEYECVSWVWAKNTDGVVE